MGKHVAPNVLGLLTELRHRYADLMSDEGELHVYAHAAQCVLVDVLFDVLAPQSAADNQDAAVAVEFDSLVSAGTPHTHKQPAPPASPCTILNFGSGVP